MNQINDESQSCSNCDSYGCTSPCRVCILSPRLENHWTKRDWGE